MQSDIDSQLAQESRTVSQQLASDVSKLLAPVLATLDAQLDVRLVRTVLATIAVILQLQIWQLIRGKRPQQRRAGL